MQANFLTIAQERCYMHQCTNFTGLSNLLQEQSITAYIGFDCTATSLHIGSLVQIMMLRLLQKMGHKIIVLLGGGTTKIGDPSGKDKSRSILSETEIEKNTLAIKLVLEQFINFNNSNAIIVDNSEWLTQLHYIEFLRDIGKHFSVNRMLDFESVKLRLNREQHLSFLEFNYMLLQAYDFVELYNRNSCRLQIGGSDQWGNIISGIELGRKLEHPEFFGLTTPLITTADGIKMGKTSGRAIWLSSELFSPYDYWQYFRNVDDKDVGKFLRLFTDLPIDEITKLENLKSSEINEAKKILATQATAICHGQEATQQASSSAIAEFEHNDSSLLPTVNIDKENITLVKLVAATNFAPSNSAAKRAINTKSVYVNDIIIDDPNYLISSKNNSIKLSLGKKRCRVTFKRNK